MSWRNWNWEKIIDRLLRVMFTLLLAWFAYNVYDNWGTTAAAGFANAFIWLGMYWMQMNMGRDWRRISKEGLEGWRDALQTNDKIMEVLKESLEKNVKLGEENAHLVAEKNTKPKRVRKLKVKRKR